MHAPIVHQALLPLGRQQEQPLRLAASLGCCLSARRSSNSLRYQQQKAGDFVAGRLVLMVRRCMHAITACAEPPSLH